MKQAKEKLMNGYGIELYRNCWTVKSELPRQQLNSLCGDLGRLVIYREKQINCNRIGLKRKWKWSQTGYKWVGGRGAHGVTDWWRPRRTVTSRGARRRSGFCSRFLAGLTTVEKLRKQIHDTPFPTPLHHTHPLLKFNSTWQFGR